MNRCRCLVLLVAWVAAGCSLDPASNPAHCASDADCGADQRCRLFEGRDDGLCVSAPSIDAGLDGGQAEDGGLDAGTDGGPSCVAGESCYSGEADTEDVGRCHAGTVECVDGIAFCRGEVTPALTDETCDAVDDDCDAAVDEDAMPMGNCVLGQPGVCAQGERRCFEGTYRCRPVHEASAEICDGEDNDCDNLVDEDADAACFDGTAGCEMQPDGSYTCVGVCRAGVHECADGVLGSDCVGQILPATEQCTVEGPALDENCNGMVDEGCTCSDGETQDCYPGAASVAGIGACELVTQTCAGSTWGECAGATLPAPETCDSTGVDDDCNGVPDDVPGVGESCLDEAAQGVCRRGELVCSGAETVCETPDPRPNESFCDSRDDDCDSEIDEDYDLATSEEHCGECNRSCGTGRQCCAGACTDPLFDDMNCGDCGTNCGAGQSCCGGGCVDLSADPTNCGECGNVCPGEQTCCGGACVDTRTSTEHCSECGLACGDGDACCDGVCADPGSTACTDCAVDCVAPADMCCAGSCVDITSDPSNCDGCGLGCETGQSCCDSGCTFTATDEANCGGCGTVCGEEADTCCAGGCVDTGSDPRHCGGCGMACEGGQLCCGGTCVDPDANDQHCGQCGRDCTVTDQQCSAGECCQVGFDFCASAEEAGACVDLSSNELHCGECGSQCSSGQTCCGGTCVNTGNDEAHCGSCGEVCESPTGTCCGGGCVNTSNNGSHCGRCGNSCGLLSCRSGSCGL